MTKKAIGNARIHKDHPLTLSRSCTNFPAVGGKSFVNYAIVTKKAIGNASIHKDHPLTLSRSCTNFPAVGGKSFVNHAIVTKSPPPLRGG